MKTKESLIRFVAVACLSVGIILCCIVNIMQDVRITKMERRLSAVEVPTPATPGSE